MALLLERGRLWAEVNSGCRRVQAVIKMGGNKQVLMETKEKEIHMNIVFLYMLGAANSLKEKCF